MNTKPALQFSLLNLNINALGFFYIRTPQLAHIQDPL